MADDEKAKAEKLAAAKKRVEEMKKQKAKKGAAGSGAGVATKKKPKDEASASTTDPKPEEGEEEGAAPAEDSRATTAAAAADEAGPSPLASPITSSQQQSKLRSASFRAGSGAAGPMSPISPPDGGGETAADIYRKQVARIEDLERENKRLAKESSDAEKRWQKAENDLADMREADGPDGGKKTSAGSDSQVETLQNELAALQRQNSQLQAASRRGHGSASVSAASPPSAALQAQLDSKSSTIESMELELSRLRAQVERQSSAGGSDREQIVALEGKLARAEQAAAKSAQELGDLKRNLDRTAEKAVREGSSRTSAETKLRTLEQENETLQAEQAELVRKHDALEKKVAALGTLHKENDSRTQALRREKDAADKDVAALRAKVNQLEAECARLRKQDAAEGGGDDDGVDELEDEGRRRLEKKVRDLEAENYDLRRGIWHQRRKDLEPGMGDSPSVQSPGSAAFTNIDLGGGGSPGIARKSSTRQGGSFGDFFNVLKGGGGGGVGGGAAPDEKDDLLLDDDDGEFDEDAFRRAHEEDARKRLERIKDIKRGLKNWEGWRLDLVDSRRGGGAYGVGDVFEI